MGAEFLEVDFKESGEGAGGYAKEMSPEWHAAANRMLSKQCEEVDIVITTALIPGKKAPTLITADMVSKLKPGSVCVDLAASAGGNIVGTVKDQRFVTSSGVTMLGYTDLNSRLASTSSSLYASHLTKHGLWLHASACTCSRRGESHDQTWTLAACECMHMLTTAPPLPRRYANNQTKWILSAGPTTTKTKGKLCLDHEDIAVRGMMVIENGASELSAIRLPSEGHPKAIPSASEDH